MESFSGCVEGGLCEIVTRGFVRHLKRGECRLLPALEPMGLVMLPGAKLALASVHGVMPSPRENCCSVPLVIDDLRQRRPLTAQISAAVYAAPDIDWRLDTAGALVGLSAAMLSRRLMQESESLREIIRRQRLSRYAFDLLAGFCSGSAFAYGFSDQCHLENALFERFGATAEALTALSHSGAPRFPAGLAN